MAKNRGTSYELGQYNEILVALTKALPKALQHTDPKEMIRTVGNGEKLERALQSMFASLGEGESEEDDDIIHLTLGGRNYEAPRIIAQGDWVKGDEMMNRAKEKNATLGREDCEWFLEHQGDIPKELRGEVVFIFTEWCHPGDSRNVAIVCWNGDRWIQGWGWLESGWSGGDRPVRRST